MNALVYKSTGSWYQVKDETGKLYHARIKGKLKVDHITSTNPVAVGDWVHVNHEGEDYIITSVEARHNYINRVSPHNKNQQHIVAANLDQSLLFATLKDPKTSFGFIDRFLVTAEAYHVKAIIVWNKADLWGKKEMEKLLLARKIYEPIGYEMYSMSLAENKGVDEMKSLLKDKTTLLSGHSGVGKSTFINELFPHLDLKTQDVSAWSGKGMHTTTFAEMFDLPGGGKIIDTPGIREMGLADIEKDELSHYFPEMRRIIQNCRFNNCNHIDEPGCAVKAAVAKGKIFEERYLSYLSIRDSIQDEKW